MSVLHKLLEKLHLARHADVVDPEAVAREIEDKFKQEVADAIKRLDEEGKANTALLAARVNVLEQQLMVHGPATLTVDGVNHFFQPAAVDLGMAPLPPAQTSASEDGRKEPGEVGQVHAAAEHTDGTDQHTDHHPDSHRS